VSAALALGSLRDLSVGTTRATLGSDGAARARVDLEEGDWIASFELAGDGWRGRARHGAPPPPLVDGFGVSDPVLVDGRVPEDAEALLQNMLPSTVLRDRSPARVYLEVYGVAENEPLRFAATVGPANETPSLLRRIGRALRLSSGARPPVVLAWTEPAENVQGRTLRRFLDLDLGDLGNGEYRLEIEVARSSGEAAVSSRMLRLAR
jgi:hypothetical protein